MPAPRKSNIVHLRDGTFRADRHAGGSGSVVPLDPTPAAHLTPTALIAWGEIVATCG